jgi:hypothetical protein
VPGHRRLSVRFGAKPRPARTRVAAPAAHNRTIVHRMLTRWRVTPVVVDGAALASIPGQEIELSFDLLDKVSVVGM